MDAPDDEYLSKKQIAMRLGISVQGTHRFLRREAIPFVRIGRLVRFSQKDLDKFLSDNRTAS